MKLSVLLEILLGTGWKLRVKLAKGFTLMHTGNVINLMIALCRSINAIYTHTLAISFRLSNSIATNYISNRVISLTHFVPAFRKLIVPKLRMESHCGAPRAFTRLGGYQTALKITRTFAK